MSWDWSDKIRFDFAWAHVQLYLVLQSWLFFTSDIIYHIVITIHKEAIPPFQVDCTGFYLFLRLGTSIFSLDLQQGKSFVLGSLKKIKFSLIQDLQIVAFCCNQVYLLHCLLSACQSPSHHFITIRPPQTVSGLNLLPTLGLIAHLFPCHWGIWVLAT